MKTALAIAAHPDDIEFLMAGTLLSLGEKGYELHYFNLADGSCGSQETDAATTASIRRAESQHAAKFLGATFHASICRDLEIFYDRETLGRVAAVIREVQPDIILTHAPLDYMEDHMNASRLAVSAAFARGMPNFTVAPQRAAYASDVAVYHAQPYYHRDPLGNVVTPDFFVDVSDKLDRKQAALACHVSQKAWLDASQGQGSYLETLKELDAELGRASALFTYAEGWRRHFPIGLSSLSFDPLRDALSDRITPGRPETA